MEFRIKNAQTKLEFSSWCRRNGFEDAANLIDEVPREPKPKKNRTTDNRTYYREEYLKTEAWFDLRNKKLAMTPVCEKCGSTRRLDAHHLRYKNLYDVTADDLMTLCRICHTKWHRKDVSVLFDEFLASGECVSENDSVTIRESKPKRIKFSPVEKHFRRRVESAMTGRSAKDIAWLAGILESRKRPNKKKQRVWTGLTVARY